MPVRRNHPAHRRAESKTEKVRHTLRREIHRQFRVSTTNEDIQAKSSNLA